MQEAGLEFVTRWARTGSGGGALVERSPHGRAGQARERAIYCALMELGRWTDRGAGRTTLLCEFTVPYTAVYTENMTKLLRVSERTHEGFKREAERRGETIDSVATAALRALRQKEMGRQLAEPLGEDEQSWLDADLG